jgi:predicted acyl esterase
MPEKTYDVVQVEKDLMIPMRDGVKMATDIYRPFIKDESSRPSFRSCCTERRTTRRREAPSSRRSISRSTVNVFKKGHRIRLDISSSNFPRFDVNPNTGEPIGMNRREQVADNSVYHDAAHPSSVVLPIVGRPAPGTQPGR